MSTIYKDEAILAFGFGMTSLVGCSVLVGMNRWLKQQRKATQVKQAQPAKASSITNEGIPSRIEIIEASGHPDVDRMNICKVIKNSRYIEQGMMDVTEIKCRRPEGEIGQLGKMIFLDQVKSQIQAQYPTRQPMPMTIYLNKSHIIIIY